MIEDKAISFLGGVNLLSDPLRLRDDEALKLKNLYPGEDGKMAMRKGASFEWFWQRAVSPDGNAQSNDYPANLWAPKFAPNAFIMVSHNNAANELMVVVGLNGDSPLVNSVSKRIAVTLLSGYRPAMVDYGARTLIATGVPQGDGSCVWEVSFTALGAFQIVATPLRFVNPTGQYVAPRVMFVYRGRMMYANFGPGLEDVVVFADSDDQPYKINAGAVSPANATVNVGDVGGRSLRVLGLGGDGIIGGIEVSVANVGNEAEQTAFLLASEKAMFMPGEPLQTDDTPATGERYSGTLAPRSINYPCGCVSPDTIVKTPMGILWASWNDVWAMGIGGIPTRVGTKIRPALSGGDPESRYMWHAAYHHDTGSYRLAVVAPDQDVDPLRGFVVPCKDQWWLDLRFGIPQQSADARWYGPQQYVMQDTVDTVPAYPGTFIMRSEDRANAPSKLWAAHRVSRAPTGSGLLASSLITCLVQLDAQAARDSALPVVPSIAGTIFIEILPSEQLGNEIVFEILTKEFDFDNPTVDKVFHNLDFHLWVSDVMTLEAYGWADGGRDQKVMNINIDQMGFVGGVDPIGSARMTHQYQAVRLQCDNGERLTGKVLQFRIKNALTGGSGFENISGFPVPENGINSQLLFSDDGVLANQVTININPGFYSSLSVLMTEIERALTASGVIGDSFTMFIDSVTFPDTKPVCLSSDHAVDFVWHTDMATPALVSDASSEAAKTLRRSRKVAAMLGFYETPNSVSDIKNGVNNIAKTISAHCELASAKLTVYHFQRKPSGGKYEPNVS